MLTERQQAVLDFVRTFQMSKGIPPSTREIQRHFGFASQTAVMGHLRALANKGMIEQLAGRVWGLKAREVQAHLFEIGVFGTIPAGLPSPNEQQADETIAVDPAAFGLRGADRIFGLSVRGDSMIGAHIVEGDIVLLSPRPARSGDIVAALVEGETTLKRLVTVRGRPVLRAENPRYRDIVPGESFQIQGVMVGVVGRGRR